MSADKPSDRDQTDFDPAKRVKRGGVWRDVPGEGSRSGRADKTISVRLTEAELAEFDAQIEALGLKRNRAMRIAARRIGGFVEVDAETLALLKDAQAQIKGIATNINQIAKLSNRLKSPQHAAFFEERGQLGRELARLQDGIQQILELNRRRHDGLARLREAMAE